MSEVELVFFVILSSGIAWAGTDQERAHQFAETTGGVMIAVPIAVDYRACHLEDSQRRTGPGNGPALCGAGQNVWLVNRDEVYKVTCRDCGYLAFHRLGLTPGFEGHSEYSCLTCSRSPS